MEYKRHERKMPVCLECGDRIRYGRSDKKFCCEECRNRHYYGQVRTGRSFKRRILRILSNNYEILEGVMRSGVESILLADLMVMGFIPSVVTSYRKNGKHDEYGCFDIKYIMTDTRVYSMSKIQNFD